MEPTDDTKIRLLDAALPHVPFDGWTNSTLHAAVAEAGVDPTVARAVCPRGGLDLAVAFHRRGDEEMRRRLKAADLANLKFREKVALAVRLRIEAVADHKESVRRGTTLFSLPHNGMEGARLIWGTADAIWDALGDTSNDYNWYTKRATLSGVYGSTVLYWLGDESPESRDTWSFLDRRIGDVMQIEKAKATAKSNPVLSKLLAGPEWALSWVKPPAKMPRPDFPGFHSGRRGA